MLMPRKKPLKINYMDMKIPFDCFRIPKSKSEQIKLVKRFDLEFGEDYEFDPWIDPADDYIKTENGYELKCKSIFEVKLERIKLRKELMAELNRAIESNDSKAIAHYNSLRELPVLPGSDNGWNIKPAMKKRRDEMKGCR